MWTCVFTRARRAGALRGGRAYPRFEGANPPASSSGLDPIATVQTKLAGLGVGRARSFPWEVATSARRWCQAKSGERALSEMQRSGVGRGAWG
jgi:hypothetical protein